MREFLFIPVIDLKAHSAVKARKGQRSDYRVLESPFYRHSCVRTLAGDLLAVTSSPILYMADLDAIMGTGSNEDLVDEVAEQLDQATLWVDPGVRTAADVQRWSHKPNIKLVIGSETFTSCGEFEQLVSDQGDRIVLSLDFGKDGFRGDRQLLDRSYLWPDDVIVMSLGRVGSGEGPDFQMVEEVIGRSGARVYAAGGLRHMDDAHRLFDLGARGVLVASALHSKTIGQKEIAAFLKRAAISTT